MDDGTGTGKRSIINKPHKSEEMIEMKECLLRIEKLVEAGVKSVEDKKSQDEA